MRCSTDGAGRRRVRAMVPWAQGETESGEKKSGQCQWVDCGGEAS